MKHLYIYGCIDQPKKHEFLLRIMDILGITASICNILIEYFTSFTTSFFKRWNRITYQKFFQCFQGQWGYHLKNEFRLAWFSKIIGIFWDYVHMRAYFFLQFCLTKLSEVWVLIFWSRFIDRFQFNTEAKSFVWKDK